MFTSALNTPKRVTATGRIPYWLMHRKPLGACPAKARPSKTVEPSRGSGSPADHAGVKITASMTEGTTLVPVRLTAIVNGDCEAFPVVRSSVGSFDGTTSPTMKLTRHKRRIPLSRILLCRHWNGHSQILGLGRGQTNGFDTGISMDCVGDSRPGSLQIDEWPLVVQGFRRMGLDPSTREN